MIWSLQLSFSLDFHKSYFSRKIIVVFKVDANSDKLSRLSRAFSRLDGRPNLLD